MSEQERVEVVRPARKCQDGRLSPFSWVHLYDGKGGSHCGEEYDMGKYVLQVEIVDWDTLSRKPSGLDNLCRKCAAKHFQFDVETVQHGQARAYQDSWYKYNVTDLREGEPRDYKEVLEFCLHWVKWSCHRGVMTHPFQPQFMCLNEHQPGEWRYEVRSLYTG